MSDEPKEFQADPVKVARAIERLPYLDREAIVLRSRHGLSYTEIGAILGLSAEAAEARFASALVKLRAKLEPRPRRRWWPW